MEEQTQSGWKILFHYLLGYKREIIILSILGVISALSNAAVPYLVGRFFDALLKPATVSIGAYEVPLWLSIIVVWLFIQLIANFTDWVNERKSRYIGTKIDTSYTARAANHLLALPLSFHKENKHGEVWDKLNRAGRHLSGIAERVVINLAPQFLGVVVGISFALFISVEAAIVLVVGVVLYVAILTRVVKPVSEAQTKGHEAWNKAYGIAYDAIANYQTVKHATAEEYEEKRINKNFVGGVLPLWYKVEKIWSNIAFSQRIIVLLTQLSIFLLAVFLVQKGDLTVGQLVALNGYALMVFGPFVTLGYNWQTVQNGLTAIERAEEVLSIEHENANASNKKKLEEARGDVEFKNVHFAYNDDKNNVLNDISFSVQHGEKIAFVGESGVGKSTAIELISGYYFPQKGNVYIDGISTKEIDLMSLRKHVAIVPQEPVLFNDTIEVNIKYGNFNVSLDEVKEAAQKAHADIFIEKFPEKYNQLVGERGVKLSVGQKQRIAIARAILRNPEILILDEPTSALDPQTENFIQKSLNELMEGRTTFIIAHRLSTVRKANRIFVFDGGKIIETGTHEELIQKENGFYKKLHDLHIGLT